MQGGGHGRCEPTRDGCCRLSTEKSFLPGRVRGQNPLFHHRFLEQKARSALVSLAYRNSNFFRLTGCQSGKLVQVPKSAIPNSSSPQNPAPQDQGLQLDNLLRLGRSSGQDDPSSLQRHPPLRIFTSGWAWQCKGVT